MDRALTFAGGAFPWSSPPPSAFYFRGKWTSATDLTINPSSFQDSDTHKNGILGHITPGVLIILLKIVSPP